MQDDGERLLYVALGVAAGTLLALIWVSGALAGALFGTGWASMPPGASVAVALRLPFHLGDPRAAWPSPQRAQLPGAVGMYGALVLTCLAAGAIGVFAAKRLRGVKLPALWHRREKPPAARWASGRDLEPLRVSEPQPHRLILGRNQGRLLAAEAGQSVIVFGPTQTHKTSGLVIPSLLEWQGPVLCTSVKSDVLKATRERRENLGTVWVFDPAEVTDGERSKATPLRGAESWAGALRVAHWLAGSAKGGASDLRDADFWFATAEKLIAPLLFVAARKKGTMGTVVAWLDQGPDACEADVLAKLGEIEKEKGGGEEAAVVRRAFMATQNREERQRSSVYTTAETILASFADPRVARQTAGSGYTPEELLAGPNTLYLITPNREHDRLRPVFATLVQELLALIEERATQREEPIEPRVLLLLDECANMAAFPGLDETASIAAGLGVQLVTIFQDLAQMQVRFGPRAWSIVNNHRAIVAGTGISDRETLSYLSGLIGSGEFEQRSVSTSKGERGRRSFTEGDTYRDLAPGHLLREQEMATAILVYGNLRPAMIDLRPWFEDPALRALREGKSEEAAGQADSLSEVQGSDRPEWLGGLPGVVIGEEWRFEDPEHPDEEDLRWAIVWNAALGEVFAVQILSAEERGRVLLLGVVPAGPLRDGMVELIERERDSEQGQGPAGVMYVAGLLKGLNAGVAEARRRRSAPFKRDRHS